KAAGRGHGQGQDRLRTVLTGCWATESPDKAASLAGVDLVVPNAEKDRLLVRVCAAFPDLSEVEESVPCSPMPERHTRALAKIEDGWNMRGAFCMIPFTRGAQASRPLGEILEEVGDRVREGYREVVLTGVQISAWRQGTDRLAGLVEAILAGT